MKKIYSFIVLSCFCINGFAQTTFNYTGGLQTYTVPVGVTSITVDLRGAKGGGVDCAYGGGTYQSHGGCGGRVQATLTVTPGHVLNITVGGIGASVSGAGGYGGGGTDVAFTTVWPGAGGGGGTRIVDNTSGTLLAVAGGGGGGGGDFCYTAGIGMGIGDFGGNGGGLIGATGNSNICGVGTGGHGGTQTAGGAAGVCSGMSGTAGSLGLGASCTSPDLGSGGGGGGYYGGGSGGYSGGGGGGSSYTNATFASVITHTQGYNCGNGSVIINIACTPPAAITGTTFAVCLGSTISLADATTGGTWSSSASGIASVGTTGIVTGVSAGTAIITYALSTGCAATAVVIVNPLPALITGTLTVCAGNTTTLTDISGVGTWTSSNTGVSTVGTATGVVTGVSTGTSTIDFTLTATGCSTTSIVTVNAAAAPITGTAVVCQGSTTPLFDAATGGTWSSFNPGIASIGTTGIVTGVSGGVTTITYMLPGGCYATQIVTVNPLPLPITGPAAVCLGSTITLADATGGGTWSSSAPGIAPIDAILGIVSGASVGSATITYSILGTGCYKTFNETVNALPANILGIPTLCANTTTSLTDATGGGTWSSSATGIATINTSGLVTGVSAGITTITYMLGTSCNATLIVTVLPIPAPITGDSMVCSGSSATVSDITTGSTWSISGPGATIGGTTGIVTGSITGSTSVINTVTYTINATGCKVTKSFTVNPLPFTIAGITMICDSSTSLLNDALGGGTWSSSNTLVCTINASTGLAYGIGVGTSNIIYIITATGCMTSTIVTVQPPPAPISGVQEVCPGLTTTLSDLITSGVWTSGTTAVATIDSFTGVIAGITPGTTVITYYLGVCSTTEMVTVNPLPTPILGTSHVCTNGAVTDLTDATSGGIWTSSVTSVATIDPVTGIVTSVTVGTTIITYKLTATGCYITDVLTVNPLPAPILGTDSVCLGYYTTLSDASVGGTFSSLTPLIATVGASSGTVLGVFPGVATIEYTLTYTGCKITVPVTVNPILTISTLIHATRGDTICAGSTDTYIANSVNAGPSPVYQWKVNSINVGGPGNSYTYSPINGDAIKCVLTSNATCAIPNTTTSNIIHMMVNDVTNPTVKMLTPLKDTMCVGEAQTFTVATMQGGTTPILVWTVNWLPVGTGDSSYTYIPNNGDIIRCGLISSSPCPVPDTAFAIDTMVVYNYDTPRVAIVNPGSTSCQGNMITLVANTTAGGSAPSYLWTLNGVPTGGSGDTYSYSPTDNDIVTCQLTSSYFCPLPSNITTDTMIVHVDPVIIVTITGNPGVLVTIGRNDTLYANAINAGDDPTYQWYVNGVIVPGANYYKYITNSLHNQDSVSCRVTTGSGSACEGVIGFNWMIVAVAPAGIIKVGNNICEIKLVPNPNTGIFTVEGTLGGMESDVVFEITDVIGQVVYKVKAQIENGQIKHNISLDNTVANGVYVLHLITDGSSNNIKFTINR